MTSTVTKSKQAEQKQISVRHSDGTYGILDIDTGLVIWADGHGDKFDLRNAKDFKLLCQYVVASAQKR